MKQSGKILQIDHIAVGEGHYWSLNHKLRGGGSSARLLLDGLAFALYPRLDGLDLLLDDASVGVVCDAHVLQKDIRHLGVSESSIP